MKVVRLLACFASFVLFFNTLPHKSFAELAVGADDDRNAIALKNKRNAQNKTSSITAPRSNVKVEYAALCHDLKGSHATGHTCTQPVLCTDGRQQYAKLVQNLNDKSDSQISLVCQDTHVVDVAAAAQEEFRRITLAISAPSIQPDDGTLCNWPTVFYSDVRQYDTTVTVLGEQVTLRIIPVKYVWHFGDGNTETTTSPGNRLNIEEIIDPAELEKEADVSYRYPTKGEMKPSLTVTFRGQFSLPGGEFQTIDGTVTTDSPTTTITVKEARAELVHP